MSSVGDPAKLDRVATTLAMLRVNHEMHQSHVGGYLPFVYHCLREDDDEVVAIGPLQTAIEQEFGLQLPRGVLRALLAEAALEGKVRRDRGTYHRVPDQLADCGLDQDRAAFGRRFGTLAERLRAFAAASEVTISVAEAKALLIGYADGFSSDVLNAAMAGAPIPAASPAELSEHMYVVHRFASAAVATMANDFDFLVGLVQARMLADAMHYQVITGQEASLKGLEVYLDGPILLYLRGAAGDELAAPYRELVSMLLAAEAKVRCFEHSVTEAQEILDAAAARKNAAIGGEQYHGDVVAFLVRSDRSRTDIALEAERLPDRLSELGVETIATPPRIIELQANEEDLEVVIREHIPYLNRVALLRDIDSLTAVDRLRRGRPARTIASAGAVFVTHNYALFKASTRFFDGNRSGTHVPHCVHDAGFTTVVWLHSPKQHPHLAREFVLADAAAAMNPSDDLWARYNAATQQLFERGDIDENDLRFLRLSDDARSLLMDITKGNPDTFTTGTVTEIRDLYHQRVIRDEIANTKAAEEKAVQAAAATERVERSLSDALGASSETGERVRGVSRTIARVVVDIPVFAVLVLLILGSILGPAGPVGLDLPGPLQIACASVAIACALGFTVFGGSVRDLRDAATQATTDRVERTIRQIFGLPDSAPRR